MQKQYILLNIKQIKQLTHIAAAFGEKLKDS